MRGINTVIIVKIGGLGDFIFGVPALNLIRKKLPNTTIILVTAKSLNNTGFKYSGGDPRSYVNLPWINLVKNIFNDILNVPDLSLQSIKRLRSLLPQDGKKAIFILGYPGMTLSSILKKFIFCRLISNYSDICFGTNKFLDSEFMREFQTNHKLLKHKLTGDIDSVMEAFPNESFDYNDLDFNVFIDKNTAINVCSEYQIKYPHNLILVAPVATTLHKQWPIENFVEIIKRVNPVRNHYSIVLIGTSDHYTISHEFFVELGFEVNNLCGALSIDEISALLSIAKGYIGNDGGMSQLAGLLGTPSVIAFNSIEEEWVTFPWRSLNGIVRNKPECSPCYNELACPESHRKCMIDISVDSVYSKVDKIILRPSV